jgi:hypothetical protein
VIILFKNIYRRCSVCGKRGAIKITDKDKILSDWKYFGKININSDKTDKYYYRVVFNKKGNIAKNKDGSMKTIKHLNKEFDKKAKPKLFEYWECPTCFSKAKN